MSASWGNLFQPDQDRSRYQWRGESLPQTGHMLLPIGNRRSYGDVCVCEGGTVVETAELNRFSSFDVGHGIVRCDAGVTLLDLARLVVPHGWFLPVTPGTSFVTVGGAVANDVHGKNHHKVGSFGCFVRRFGLLRSDQQELVCSPVDNPELFAATLGGLGLTGIITWVEMSLLKIRSTDLTVHTESFDTLQQFVEISDKAHSDNDYCVSWIDCSGASTGECRGVFFRADHSNDRNARFNAEQFHDFVGPSIPALVGKIYPIINPLSVRLFNNLYRFKHRHRQTKSQSMFQYFYPLDALQHWNRLYGKDGFYQFQCVVPRQRLDAVEHMLKIIRQSGQGSFLSVLKIMGDIQSKALIGFSRPGITLALDFPNRGARTVALMQQLENCVVEASGAIYPAKDSLMSAQNFKQFYPRWQELERLRDPVFSSSFWRRVTA